MRARLLIVLTMLLASACMPDTDQRAPETTSTGAEDLGGGADDALLIDSDGRIDDDDPM
ncbi:hypothetical protein [Sandaracinus amylolyticus]|uniref:Uncharacterized protein n=1 Tax=Sandaracinus amylolyticus TaxID=927083 RepID=A0A0F6W045_9BACT|nr:hypothetical protein [Sandaracinus amylolyticus]AKF04068.1 hypothetical protein DB32_001217 [Sandaracinus amylolyticus]